MTDGITIHCDRCGGEMSIFDAVNESVFLGEGHRVHRDRDKCDRIDSLRTLKIILKLSARIMELEDQLERREMEGDPPDD